MPTERNRAQPSLPRRVAGRQLWCAGRPIRRDGRDSADVTEVQMTAPWLSVAVADPSWPVDESAVMDAVESARSAVGRLYGPRGVRDGTGRVAAAAAVRAARASAALEGASLVLDRELDAIADPILAGSVRVAAELGGLAATWRRAPRQVLARLHTLAAADLVPRGELGRPRVDPGRSDLVSARLSALADLVVSSPWPAPVLVAIVHGELATLAPFGSADAVVARAAARLTMISTGLDPSGLAVPEVAQLRARAGYRAGLVGYRAGNRVGLDAWVAQVCDALVRGAAEGAVLAAASE